MLSFLRVSIATAPHHHLYIKIIVVRLYVTDVGVAVTDLRVVCKIITCVDKFAMCTDKEVTWKPTSNVRVDYNTLLGVHMVQSRSAGIKKFLGCMIELISLGSQASLALSTSQFLLPPFIACIELVRIVPYELVVIVKN